MGARRKLNRIHFGTALAACILITIATKSFALGLLSAIISIGYAMYHGDIRSESHVSTRNNLNRSPQRVHRKR